MAGEEEEECSVPPPGLPLSSRNGPEAGWARDQIKAEISGRGCFWEGESGRGMQDMLCLHSLPLLGEDMTLGAAAAILWPRG